MFPGLNFINDYVCARAFGVTKDRLSFIGRNPDFEDALFVLGLEGNDEAPSTEDATVDSPV